LALAMDAPLNDDLHPRVDLWAPKARVDGLTRANNLELLLGLRRPWPDGLIRDDDPQRAAGYRSASEGFAEALGHYLRGEIVLRRRLAAGQPIWASEVFDHHLAAY